MASEIFEMQVALLVRVLPYVATENCFALKGGSDQFFHSRSAPPLGGHRSGLPAD